MLPFVTAWMNLEGIMLSEINQTEKDKYCMISLTQGVQKIKQTNKIEHNLQTYRTDGWLPEKRWLETGKSLKGVRRYKQSVTSKSWGCNT